jgi:hypothetical protein
MIATTCFLCGLAVSAAAVPAAARRLTEHDAGGVLEWDEGMPCCSLTS